MIVNYLSWSTFISLLATILLYPLRHHAQGPRVTRICAAIFLFPSLVSAIIAQISIARTDTMFVSIARLAIVKLQFGFLLSQSNITLVISVNLLMVFLIFFLSKRNFVEHCSFAALTALFLFIIAATPDQLVRISALSIGSIALTCALLSNDIDKTAVNLIIRDFILNRLSDLFAFSALINTLSQFNYFIISEINTRIYNIDNSSMILFFISIILRLASLCLASRQSTALTVSSTKFIVFYRLLLGVGSQLLFIFYLSPTVHDEKQFTIFLAIGIILVLYSLIVVIFNHEKPYSINNIATLLFTSNLVVIMCNLKVVAIGVICVMITLYPAASLLLTRRSAKNSVEVPLLKSATGLRNYLNNAATIATQAMLLMANFFIGVFTVIYSGFLLFRLPQFTLATLQMPLRFLNNGSIQRSLIFVAIVLIAYSYWGGKR